MSKCDGCGAETTRYRTTFDKKGNVIGGECASCKPERFTDPFDPLDRLVSGPEAFPHLYTRDSEGVYHAKDELIADTAAGWDKGPTERNIERKRATRRTKPMTEDEIAAAQRWGDDVVRPQLKRMVQ
jgi:hypothetical protein